MPLHCATSLCAVLLLILLTHTRVLVPTLTTIMSLSDVLCVKVAGLCSSGFSKPPAHFSLHHSSASNSQSLSWDWALPSLILLSHHFNQLSC